MHLYYSIIFIKVHVSDVQIEDNIVCRYLEHYDLFKV